MSEAELRDQAVLDEEVAGGDKLVSVSEAIRYRKRAQSAEKELAEIREKFDEIKASNVELLEKVNNEAQERQLISSLSDAGAGDLEAAVLLVKSRLSKSDDADIGTVVAELKAEKGYLFEQKSAVSAPEKTSGVKNSGGKKHVLKKIASEAARTGSRVNVQEYLKARRTL